MTPRHCRCSITGSRREPEVGAAQVLRHVRMLRGESLHVAFVDDRAIPRDARRPVVAPGEGGFDDDALRRDGRAVERGRRRVLVRLGGFEAEERRTETAGVTQRACVRIDEELARIEAMPARRVVRPVDAIAVELTRPHVGQVAVPDAWSRSTSGTRALSRPSSPSSNRQSSTRSRSPRRARSSHLRRPMWHRADGEDRARRVRRCCSCARAPVATAEHPAAGVDGIEPAAAPPTAPRGVDRVAGGVDRRRDVRDHDARRKSDGSDRRSWHVHLAPRRPHA